MHSEHVLMYFRRYRIFFSTFRWPPPQLFGWFADWWFRHLNFTDLSAENEISLLLAPEFNVASRQDTLWPTYTPMYLRTMPHMMDNFSYVTQPDSMALASQAFSNQ